MRQAMMARHYAIATVMMPLFRLPALRYDAAIYVYYAD